MPVLGGAVALDDDDAEVLPGLLERGRQERPGRHEQPEVRRRAGAWTRRKSRRRSAHRQVAGDAPEPVERGRPAPLLDLALDRAPEQVEHLRDHDHRGHPVVAQRIEDDPRVAAPDVQDVGADIERVEQPDRLLEQVRQRQQRDEPVLHRRDDRGGSVSIDARMLSWVSITPLGVPVVPEVKIELEDLVGRRAVPGVDLRSQSAGKRVVGRARR